MEEKSATTLRIEAREEKIIQCALKIIDESGFAALRMESLHKLTGCTKGTLYNHFINREDLLCEIASRFCTSLMSYFQRVETFEGTTRERILALFHAYQIFCFRHPALFSCVSQLQNPSIMAQGSKKRSQKYHKETMRLIMYITRIIQDAVNDGDIHAQYHKQVFELAFAGWANAFGSISLLMSNQGAFIAHQKDKEQQFFLNTNISLDGLGWLPLSTDFNYQKTWDNIGNKYFKDELLVLRQT